MTLTGLEWGLLSLALLVWLMPVLMRVLGRQRWAVKHLLVALLLRGIAVGMLIALYVYGGMRDQSENAISRVRLNVLIDVSSSVVDPRRGAQATQYLDRIQTFLDKLQADTPVVLEPTTYAFARQVEQIDLPAMRQDFSALQARLGGGSSQLTFALDYLRRGNEYDQLFTVLITDGHASIKGQAADADQHQALIAAVRQHTPVLAVPVDVRQTWWEEDAARARIAKVDLSTAQQVGDLATVGVSAISQDDRKLATGFVKTFIGDVPLVPKNDWSCGLSKTRSAGRILIAPDRRMGASDAPRRPKAINCDQLLVKLPVEGGLQQLSVLVSDKWRVDTAKREAVLSSADIRSYFVKNAIVRRVLLVDGDKNGAELFLSRMFKSKDWSLDELAPGRLSSKTDFMNYDLVVINEVAPARLALNEKERASVLHNLEQYVLQGGGLALIGGKETYGHQGYAGTPIADILPVTLDPKGSSGEPPLLVTVVLDVSASLLYDSNAAARALGYIRSSLAPLNKGSKVRVLGYSDEPHLLVPMHDFITADDTIAKLKKGLNTYHAEAERRRALGLQPEGIHLYNAIYHALRPILPARQGELPVAPFAPDIAKLPHRMLVVVDASDVDQHGLVHWWVDDEGRYFSETARELAKRAAKKGVVLSFIGMVQGEHNVEQIRQRWNFVRGKLPTLDPNDTKQREAYDKISEAFAAQPELEKIAEAGGGAAYLDQYDIPLGQMARPMRDHIADATLAEYDAGHLFFRFGKDKKNKVGLAVPGHAIALQRSQAEVAAWLSDFQMEGVDRPLALWSSWVVTRDADKDSRGQVTPPAFGGRVISYIASLRDSTAENAEHRKRFYHAWRRAMKWASRPTPREQFTLQLSRGAESLQVSMGLQSLDGLAVKSMRVKAGRSHKTEQQAMLGEQSPAAVASDWVSMQRQTDGRWQASLPVPKAPDEQAEIRRMSLTFEAEAARPDGRNVRLTERAAVELNLLQPLEEPLPYFKGADRAWLSQLAASTQGAVLDIDKPVWPSSLKTEQKQITKPVETRWVWLYLLIFALALLADLLWRVMMADNIADKEAT